MIDCDMAREITRNRIHSEAKALDCAPASEIEITPDMIDAGLTELACFNPEESDYSKTVESILRAALANFVLHHPKRC